MDRYVYASCMGVVYRLSRSAWRRFLTDWREKGVRPDLPDYGKYLAGYVHDVTDWGMEQVEDGLSEI